MHQCLTANRQEMLGAQPQGHKAATFGWLDTFNSHLYRLYLLTGNDEFLKVLPVIEQLDDERSCPKVGRKLSGGVIS